MGISETVVFITRDLGVVEIEKAGAAAEGVITFTGWSPYAETPGNAAFIENYQATYGQLPDAWAAQSYATLYILANAIRTQHPPMPPQFEMSWHRYRCFQAF